MEDAMMEIIEERKAETRAKTINIQSALDK